MSDETRIDPELQDLESALRRLTLSKVTLDRDEVLYQSGWAAAVTSMSETRENVLNDKRVGATGFLGGAIWPVATVFATLAAVTMGTMLFYQISRGPDSLNNLKISNSIDLQVEESVASLPPAVGLANREDAGRPGDDRVPGTRMVEMIMEFPAGQIMSSGLVFQKVAFKAEQGESNRDSIDVPVFKSPPLNRRQLINEHAPNHPQELRNWRSLLFRSNANS